MEQLIADTLQGILSLAVSEYFAYATGSCIVVGVFAMIYRLTGKAKR